MKFHKFYILKTTDLNFPRLDPSSCSDPCIHKATFLSLELVPKYLASWVQAQLQMSREWTAFFLSVKATFSYSTSWSSDPLFFWKSDQVRSLETDKNHSSFGEKAIWVTVSPWPENGVEKTTNGFEFRGKNKSTEITEITTGDGFEFRGKK